MEAGIASPRCASASPICASPTPPRRRAWRSRRSSSSSPPSSSRSSSRASSGTDGYGSLAALINFTVILIVPGSALQVAAARQGTLGRLGRGPELAATLDRWSATCSSGMAVAVAVRRCSAREPLADARQRRGGVGGGRGAGHRRRVAARSVSSAACSRRRAPTGPWRYSIVRRGLRAASSASLVLVAAALGRHRRLPRPARRLGGGRRGPAPAAAPPAGRARAAGAPPAARADAQRGDARSPA